MTPTGTLVLVTEANARCGAGHAMRAATLGAAWLRAGRPARAIGPIELPFVRDRFARLGIPISADPVTGGEVVVVDTYDWSTRFRWSHAVEPALRVLTDDLGSVQVPPGYGVVWNPNPYAVIDMYPQFGGQLISGIDALAIREELPRWSPNPSGEILVSLGGGTPSPSVVAALTLLDQLAPDKRFACTGGWAPSRWRRIEPGAFWANAGNARSLILAAGSTVWEAAAVGIPVILLMTADNQMLVYRWGRDAGVPGVNAQLVDAEFLAYQLRALLEVPTRLPSASNGAERVADRLWSLASTGRAA